MNVSASMLLGKLRVQKQNVLGHALAISNYCNLWGCTNYCKAADLIATIVAEKILLDKATDSVTFCDCECSSYFALLYLENMVRQQLVQPVMCEPLEKMVI
jgi:hypothetical protein